MLPKLADGDDPAFGLSISELASRAGVSAAALRTWESRYGFPRPRRLSGGHRRYHERDIDAVREVVRRRATGQTTPAAIAAVVARLAEPEPSIFAGLRNARPDLAVHVISKPTMYALSRAIEDECCARAERPVLFACFQRERFYRQSQARWNELARTASVAAVFAEFDTMPAASDGPIRVPLPTDAALRREWVVVCDASDRPACLAGWERPSEGGPTADADRRFEAVWTVDPQAVRDAALLCARLVDSLAPTEPPVTALLADSTPAPASPDLLRAGGLIDRTLEYLDRREEPGGSRSAGMRS